MNQLWKSGAILIGLMGILVLLRSNWINEGKREAYSEITKKVDSLQFVIRQDSFHISNIEAKVTPYSVLAQIRSENDSLRQKLLKSRATRWALEHKIDTSKLGTVYGVKYSLDSTLILQRQIEGNTLTSPESVDVSVSFVGEPLNYFDNISVRLGAIKPTIQYHTRVLTKPVPAEDYPLWTQLLGTNRGGGLMLGYNRFGLGWLIIYQEKPMWVVGTTIRF